MKPFDAVVEPVLLIEKRVVVAVAVDEPIAKSVVLVEPLFAWIANSAQGDEEAMPIVPVVGSANAEVVAGSVPKMSEPMLRELVAVEDVAKILLPIRMLPVPVVRLLAVCEAPITMLAKPEVIAEPA